MVASSVRVSPGFRLLDPKKPWKIKRVDGIMRTNRSVFTQNFIRLLLVRRRGAIAMSSIHPRSPGFRISIAEWICFVVIVAEVLVLPLLIFLAFPVVLLIALKKARRPLRPTCCAAILLGSLLACPLSSGPMMKIESWMSRNGYMPRSWNLTQSFYRPFFHAARETVLAKPLQEYADWWLDYPAYVWFLTDGNKTLIQEQALSATPPNRSHGL